MLFAVFGEMTRTAISAYSAAGATGASKWPLKVELPYASEIRMLSILGKGPVLMLSMYRKRAILMLSMLSNLDVECVELRSYVDVAYVE